MDTAIFSELCTWLTEAGLAGKSETALLDGFCRRALDAGLPIARAAIIIDTLHPVHEGRAFLWRRAGGQTQTELVECGRELAPQRLFSPAPDRRISVLGAFPRRRNHRFLQLRPDARRGNE